MASTPAVCADDNCSWPGANLIGPIAARPADKVDIELEKKFLPVLTEFLKSSFVYVRAVGLGSLYISSKVFPRDNCIKFSVD